MNKNPFNKTTFRAVAASELRFGSNSERAIGANGELNATNKADLLSQIARLMQTASTGGVMLDSVANARDTGAASRRQALIAAFASKEAHAELGEVLADELYLAANREGFARRFLARQNLTQGQIPQVRIRMKNVAGVVASSPSKTQTQIMRDNMHFPTEFYITARPFVEKREIDQSTGDVLEEKYIEALEGIMVSEDRVLYNMVKGTVGMENNATTMVGTLNPTNLGTLRNQVTRWNLPAQNLLIANDLWTDITADSGFQQIIDPVSKHELLLTGQLGTLLGMTIFSDAYRHQQHKVLNAGDLIVFGAPENLGQYTDRGGVDAQPIDSAIEGVPGRGWMLQESLSMVLANARAVAYGNRK
jgi:hypothetical protein